MHLEEMKRFFKRSSAFNQRRLNRLKVTYIFNHVDQRKRVLISHGGQENGVDFTEDMGLTNWP